MFWRGLRDKMSLILIALRGAEPKRRHSTGRVSDPLNERCLLRQIFVIDIFRNLDF